MAEVAAIDPERPVCLARELTKLHEEIVSGTARELADELASRERIRGECVLVVGGSGEPGSRAAPWPEALAAIRASSAGERLSGRDLVEVLASAYPDARNAIYRAVIEEKA
jgi:16S rRNA (cytidine1402-2'-O)-methyltransferase